MCVCVCVCVCVCCPHWNPQRVERILAVQIPTAVAPKMMTDEDKIAHLGIPTPPLLARVRHDRRNDVATAIGAAICRLVLLSAVRASTDCDA